MGERKSVPISIQTLDTIKYGLEPQKFKVNSLIEDHYKEVYKISERSLLALLEIKVSSYLLEEMIAKFIDTAKQNEQDKVDMFPEEVTLLSTLARTVSYAENISTHISLSSH